MSIEGGGGRDRELMAQVPRIVRRKFIDSLRLNVRGGVGGMGLPKFGGVGGKGGSVYAVAKEGVSLHRIAKMFPEKTVRAANGEDSSRRKIYGEEGSHKEIEVPVGIDIYDEHKRLIGALNEEGEKVCVASGGPGGSPDSSPPFCGAKGVHQVITLDLKLLADVGLVGFPNAGKSTILKAVSKAKPKIASYPFTTIRPNLGVIFYPDLRQIKVADLPGLIEGAHYNIGMGHKFLKHVERTQLMLLVVDINGFQLSPKHEGRSCLETVLLLNKELELYKEELLDKPAMLIVNKMDLPGADDAYKDIEPHLKNLSAYASTVPEPFRPDRIIKFEEIITLSAKFDPEASDQVKEAVRRVMDLRFEAERLEEAGNKEEEIVKRGKLREVGPSLM